MLVVRAAEPPCSEPWQSSEVQWLIAAVPAGAEAGALSNSIESALRRDPGAIGGDIITAPIRSAAPRLARRCSPATSTCASARARSRPTSSPISATATPSTSAARCATGMRWCIWRVTRATTGPMARASATRSSNSSSSRVMATAAADLAQPGQRAHAAAVTYTSCPAPRADWRIRARELVLDTNTSRGVGAEPTVDFKGVPIAVPAVDLLSAQRGTTERIPVSGRRHLRPQRRLARGALVLEHRSQPGRDLHARPITRCAARARHRIPLADRRQPRHAGGQLPAERSRLRR